MQHLISITARPQPMNEWFDAKMDEAAKQVRIAEAAPELLAALQALLPMAQNWLIDLSEKEARMHGKSPKAMIEKAELRDAINLWQVTHIEPAIAAIRKATGGAS